MKASFEAAKRAYEAASARYEALSKVLDAEVILLGNSHGTLVDPSDLTARSQQLVEAAHEVVAAAGEMQRHSAEDGAE